MAMMVAAAAVAVAVAVMVDVNSKLMFINWQNHNQFQWIFFSPHSLALSLSLLLIHSLLLQSFCLHFNFTVFWFRYVVVYSFFIIIITILNVKSKNPNRYKSTVISRCVMWTLRIGMSKNTILKTMDAITLQMAS